MVGSPGREYPEVFIPGEEELDVTQTQARKPNHATGRANQLGTLRPSRLAHSAESRTDMVALRVVVKQASRTARATGSSTN